MANLYSGDIAADQGAGTNQSIRANSGKTGFESKNLSIKTHAFTYRNPANGGVCVTRFYQNLTLLQVEGVTDSGTIYVDLNKRTSPNTAGTDMLSFSQGMTTTGNIATLSNTTITADDWLYVTLSGKVGTVNFLEITITLQAR
jgi:hypothetical protein